MKRPTIFDCFCGLGGMSIGAELAGCEIIGGADFNPNALNSFRHSFPTAIGIEADFLREDYRDIFRKAGIHAGDVDVLLGGPPCQAFSVYNHRRSSGDPRAGLFLRFLDIASLLKPKWVVVENVPGLLSIDGGSLWATLVRSLRARGYAASFATIEAERLGIPQKRKRLVLLGTRTRRNPKQVLKSLTNHATSQVTVAEAISDLPQNTGSLLRYRNKPTTLYQRQMREDSGPFIMCHEAASLGSLNLARIAHVPPGGNWRDIPRDLLPQGMQRARLSDHTTRYGRLDPSKPSFTLLTKCDPHWGCFIHPERDRVITVREAARLQSIPDRVIATGTLAEQYKMIGNAVPPLLAKTIIEHLA